MYSRTAVSDVQPVLQVYGEKNTFSSFQNKCFECWVFFFYFPYERFIKCFVELRKPYGWWHCGLGVTLPVWKKMYCMSRLCMF